MTPHFGCGKARFLIIIGLVSAVGTLFAEDAPGRPETPAFERRPYEVRLFLALDPHAFDAESREAELREIRQTADRCIGDLWSFEASHITWLTRVGKQGLQRLDWSVVDQHRADQKADIWFVAAVEARPMGLRVSVRSWQPEVQSETRIVSVDIMDQRDLAVALLRLCRGLALPMGVVEYVEDRTVRIRLRAGELASPDSSFAQLVSGEVFVPMLAYRNKDKTIEKLQTIPWTFITVDQAEGSTVMGTVQSGLRLALGGKKRGRIDTLVVGLRPQHETTRLELYSQTKPPVPLVAHRLEIRTQSVIPRPTEEHPEIDPNSTLLEVKLTDRRGATEVLQMPDQRLVWLFAYSGQHLLAKVPFVPGATTAARLEVPDDASRLAAEADLQMLQCEVIDAVALRNTAIATIRTAAKKDDWTTVNQKLTLLKQQQSVATLLERLTAVRVAGTAAAKSGRDKVAEVRINRMCDEAATLVNTHLDSDKVRILREEMEALQNAVETQ
jgi:hypothetical protein